MRKLFVTGVCTLLLSASANLAQAQAVPKFAYINSQQLFQVVPGRAEAAAALQKESLAAQDQFKAMQDSMVKLTAAFEAETLVLPKAEKLKLVKDKQAAFQERYDKLQSSLQERETDLQQPLQELMQKVIEDYRSENGLTMIFDVASGQGIAAIDKNLDKTDVIMARLAKMPAPKGMTAKAPIAPNGPTAKPAGVKKPPTQ